MAAPAPPPPPPPPASPSFQLGSFPPLKKVHYENPEEIRHGLAWEPAVWLFGIKYDPEADKLLNVPTHTAMTGEWVYNAKGVRRFVFAPPPRWVAPDGTPRTLMALKKVYSGPWSDGFCCESGFYCVNMFPGPKPMGYLPVCYFCGRAIDSQHPLPLLVPLSSIPEHGPTQEGAHCDAAGGQVL